MMKKNNNRKNKIFLILGIIAFLLVISLTFANKTQAQSISIDDVENALKKEYPLLKMNELNQSLSDLKLKTVKSNWLPTVTLNMKATYQSDVTTMPINLPGIEIPELDKDQYKASIDIAQMIYDGGLNSAQKKLEIADLQVQQEEINISLKEIELMTADIFFTVISLKKSKEQLNVSHKNIDDQIAILESGVRNGVVLQSTLDQFLVEKLNLNQNITELNSLIEANIDILNQLTGLNIEHSTNLIYSENHNIKENISIQTPELKLLELQNVKIEESINLMKVQKRPMLGAFAQIGYGKPALNMFSTEFEEYYIVGLKATWNLWSGGRNNNNIKAAKIQQQMLNTQKETYLLNTELNKTRMWKNIETLQNQLENDQEILSLRESILKSFDSQFQNGVITADEYLRQLTQKTTAAISLEIHKIQLNKAKYNFNKTFGE